MAAANESLSSANADQPGGLLDELERRQDDVLDQLDELDAKLSEVLKGLEPETDPSDADPSDAAESSDEAESSELVESAEDWA